MAASGSQAARSRGQGRVSGGKGKTSFLNKKIRERGGVRRAEAGSARARGGRKWWPGQQNKVFAGSAREAQSSMTPSQTPQQRHTRLRQHRQRGRTSRDLETPLQRHAKLQQHKQRGCTSRASETKQQRHARLQRERARASRASETQEQRDARLQQLRERARASRAAETEQKRHIRLQQQRERGTTLRAGRHSNFLLEAFKFDPRNNYAQHPSLKQYHLLNSKL